MCPAAASMGERYWRRPTTQVELNLILHWLHAIGLPHHPQHRHITWCVIANWTSCTKNRTPMGCSMHRCDDPTYCLENMICAMFVMCELFHYEWASDLRMHRWQTAFYCCINGDEQSSTSRFQHWFVYLLVRVAGVFPAPRKFHLVPIAIDSPTTRVMPPTSTSTRLPNGAQTLRAHELWMFDITQFRRRTGSPHHRNTTL